MSSDGAERTVMTLWRRDCPAVGLNKQVCHDTLVIFMYTHHCIIIIIIIMKARIIVTLYIKCYRGTLHSLLRKHAVSVSKL